ncbi:MAG: OadG family protein [Cyclobacteriaceae bacterium]
MLKRFVIALIPLFLAIQVLAVEMQEAEKVRTLKGVVGEIDADTQKFEPLMGVRLNVVGSALFVLSDIKGRFELEVPDSTTMVKVELFGYRNAEIEVAPMQSEIEVVIGRNEGFMEDEGWMITIVGMAVVFASLILLFAVFKLLLPFLIALIEGKLFKRKVVTIEDKSLASSNKKSLSGEVSAAISMAIHLLESDMHDEESSIITIEKTIKNYSPWSSKIYSTQQNFRLSSQLRIRK